MENKKQAIDLYEYDPVIYPFKIWISVGENANGLSEIFKEYYGDEITFNKNELNMTDALTVAVQHKEKRKYGAVVHFKNRKMITYSMCAHEATHAAKILFEHIGADMTCHEPFEYLVGWIAECIEKVKKDTNKKQVES